jgi:hypothetical protein
MNHRTGLDRSQTLLFPERLEDYIGPENPVRFLDAFVGALDLHALGFARARCADTGRPPYGPAGLLKLYLYGYLHRVRSSRFACSDLLGLVLTDSHCLDGFGNKLSSCVAIYPLPMISAPLPQHLDIDRNFHCADARLTFQLLKCLLNPSAPPFIGRI